MSNSLRNYWRTGEPLIWITAGALGLCLVLLAGLLLLIAVHGFSGFWPRPLNQYALKDGGVVLGELVEVDSAQNKLKIKQGNRDLYGLDFRWIESDQITSVSQPTDAVIVERFEWGNFIGFIQSLKTPDSIVEYGSPDFRQALSQEQKRTKSILKEMRSLETGIIRDIAVSESKTIKRLNKLDHTDKSNSQLISQLTEKRDGLRQQFDKVEEERMALKAGLVSFIKFEAVDGKTKEVPLEMIHRIVQSNDLSFFGKIGVYTGRIWDFITENPREANTEGGVFPAIFGTVMMVIVMSIIVTPLGVLAAIYLHEYAKPGPLVTMVRIAVNNLAGVPSIVFGVFGVGFFIYGIGSTLDEWFFSANLPAPTFGTGGILWASLTLALLTVPTVIVATEEGLSALPKHWREASYALGATKFETMQRVIIPALTPAIMTGVILATARAAGEVAPLMITGVVKMAPTLPLDGSFPFFHMDRKFMHLGFHIYDLGFQSPNVDAARPMVFATTLLLLLIVIGLNSIAIVVRNRLNKKIHVGTI